MTRNVPRHRRRAYLTRCPRSRTVRGTAPPCSPPADRSTPIDFALRREATTSPVRFRSAPPNESPANAGCRPLGRGVGEGAVFGRFSIEPPGHLSCRAADSPWLRRLGVGRTTRHWRAAAPSGAGGASGGATRERSNAIENARDSDAGRCLPRRSRHCRRGVRPTGFGRDGRRCRPADGGLPREPVPAARRTARRAPNRDRTGGGCHSATRTVRERVTAPARIAQVGRRRCTLVSLNLGPLPLDLLGLRVQTSEPNLRIRGVRPGRGAASSGACCARWPGAASCARLPS